ncbi:hypothetical protein LINPERHAP2_LOCUS35005, partial [Linum perenne]
LLLLIFSGQSLQRLPIRFRHQQRKHHPCEINTPQHYQRILHSNPRAIPLIHLLRILRLSRVQEPKRSNYRPCFPSRRRYPVTRRPQPRRENLRWHHKRSRIRTEIREEESQRVHHHEPYPVGLQSPVVVGKRQREHEHRHEEEPHHLNGESSDDVDEQHREPVPWNRTAQSNQSLCPSDLINLVNCVHGVCRRDPIYSGEDIFLE